MTNKQLETSFLLYYKKVLNFCFGCVHHTQDAEDITMTIFLSLCEKKESIDFETVENYLIRSAKNRVIDIERRQKFINNTYMEIRVFDNNNWEERLHAMSIVSKLPKKMRQSITLFHIHGYSREEVAAIIKKSPNTVRNNIAAGISKLRQLSSL